MRPSDPLAGSEASSPAVVCSILESDIGATEKRLGQVPAACALVEIRADRLPLGDLAGLVRASSKPLVVTIRREVDGGWFCGSEEERRAALIAALDAGARYVDVEFDGPLRDLANGEWSRHVVLSHHGEACRSIEMMPLYRAMTGTAAA